MHVPSSVAEHADGDERRAPRDAGDADARCSPRAADVPATCDRGRGCRTGRCPLDEVPAVDVVDVAVAVVVDAVALAAAAALARVGPDVGARSGCRTVHPESTTATLDADRAGRAVPRLRQPIGPAPTDRRAWGRSERGGRGARRSLGPRDARVALEPRGGARRALTGRDVDDRGTADGDEERARRVPPARATSARRSAPTPGRNLTISSPWDLLLGGLRRRRQRRREQHDAEQEEAQGREGGRRLDTACAPRRRRRIRGPPPSRAPHRRGGRDGARRAALARGERDAQGDLHAAGRDAAAAARRWWWAGG